jgi:enamine deaminase RidA (YjgF/YER057c/UK114 family)
LEDKGDSNLPMSERVSTELKSKIKETGIEMMQKRPLDEARSQLEGLALSDSDEDLEIPSIVSGLKKHEKRFTANDTVFALNGASILDFQPGIDTKALTIEEEIRQLMTTIQQLLESRGLSWKDTALVHVYVSDMSAFGRMNAVYKTFFGINPPSRYVSESAKCYKRKLTLHFKQSHRPSWIKEGCQSSN